MGVAVRQVPESLSGVVFRELSQAYPVVRVEVASVTVIQTRGTPFGADELGLELVEGRNGMRVKLEAAPAEGPLEGLAKLSG